jgi:hypothetical protein
MILFDCTRPNILHGICTSLYILVITPPPTRSHPFIWYGAFWVGATVARVDVKRNHHAGFHARVQPFSRFRREFRNFTLWRPGAQLMAAATKFALASHRAIDN